MENLGGENNLISDVLKISFSCIGGIFNTISFILQKIFVSARNLSLTFRTNYFYEYIICDIVQPKTRFLLGRRPQSSCHAYRPTEDNIFEVVPTSLIGHPCLIIEFCVKVFYSYNSVVQLPLAFLLLTHHQQLLYIRVGAATNSHKDIESKLAGYSILSPRSFGFPIVLIELKKTLSALLKLKIFFSTFSYRIISKEQSESLENKTSM